MTACPWEPSAAAVMMSKPCDSSRASWLDQVCFPILTTMTGEHLEGNSFLLHAHQPQCFSEASNQVLCYSTCSDLIKSLPVCILLAFRAYLIAANQNKNLFTSTIRFEPLFPFPAPWLYVGVSVTSTQIRPVICFLVSKLCDKASSRGSSVKLHFFPLLLLSWCCAAPDLQRVQKKPETMWTAQ